MSKVIKDILRTWEGICLFLFFLSMVCLALGIFAYSLGRVICFFQDRVSAIQYPWYCYIGSFFLVTAMFHIFNAWANRFFKYS